MAATAAARLLLLAVVMTSYTVLFRSPPTEAYPSPAGTPQNSTEFIRRSCSATLYPSLCYTSLASYASAVAQDPIQLARVATNVSLSRVRSVSFHVSSLCRISAAGKMDRRTAAALQDCAEAMGDAVDLTRQASAELALLATAEGPDVAWRVDNAQTWMSAALTNEDTCTDGFAAVSAADTAAVGGGSVPGSSVKTDVCGRVQRAKQYTSNALALVNSLVERSR